MKNSEKLENLGFNIVGTGGGCEAWIKTVNPNHWEQSSIKGFKCKTFTMAITRDLTSDVDNKMHPDQYFSFGMYEGNEDDFFNCEEANLSISTYSMDDVFFAIEKLLNNPSLHLTLSNNHQSFDLLQYRKDGDLPFTINDIFNNLNNKMIECPTCQGHGKITERRDFLKRDK